MNRVIERKRKALKIFTIEQIGITGFIGGVTGFMFQKIYANLPNGLIWNVINITLYVIIGAVIGYFNSKRKKEDLQAELIILEYFQSKPKE